MGEQSKTVHAIKKKTKDAKQNKRYERPSSQQHKADSFICKKCGKSHLPRQCPAFGATCHACGKRNHFASVCMSEQKDTKPKHNRNVTVDSLFIGSDELKQTYCSVQKAWYTDVDIGNVTVNSNWTLGLKPILYLSTFINHCTKLRCCNRLRL